ncbi:MAG: ParA family protein, partial [Saezia sp.]
VADLVVIPVRPSPHDLRAVGATVDIVKESKKSFFFALTQAKINANLTTQAIAALSEFGVVAPSIIVDRVDFASSMIDGRTVLESDPKGKSADEIIQLFNFVKSRFNENNKTRKKEVV